MFIQALELKNFKKFADRRIEFPADITVVKGKNEAGKSTIREALIAALFFDPTTANIPKYMKEFKSWHTEDLYTLVLHFEANGENYILEKDFEKQKVFLKNGEGDMLSHDFNEIADKLHEFGGYSNKDLFG
ncbi:MAG: AAA family ATPase, partial [Candidatus Spechtbacterales bacterium]|nr:AAA family ATPase [Candidatus Spechtbacterales bacterium]